MARSGPRKTRSVADSGADVGRGSGSASFLCRTRQVLRYTKNKALDGSKHLLKGRNGGAIHSSRRMSTPEPKKSTMILLSCRPHQHAAPLADVSTRTKSGAFSNVTSWPRLRISDSLGKQLMQKRKANADGEHAKFGGGEAFDRVPIGSVVAHPRCI